MTAKLEIERVWLLRGVPRLPAHHEVWQLDQGYLVAEDGSALGRVRRTLLPNGMSEFHFNVKSGTGLIRQERESAMTREEFEAAWPKTIGRRVRKVRHRVCDGLLTFEIDQFLDFDLVLAEVELPRAEWVVSIPTWLEGWIVREVTNDSSYRNFNLSTRGAPPPQGG